MKKLVIRFNAPVVLLFALLSLLVLLLDGWTGGVSTTRFFCVYRSSLADPLTMCASSAMCWATPVTATT